MYSGERILPKKVFNVTYQQSLVAYEFAAQHAKGKTALDVASGEGYGTSLLGKTATRVVGLDYNTRAVTQAQKQYGNDSISFLPGNLLSASSVLGGELFDVVCCFQTIEHIQDHDAFLNALALVTKPGGSIIVSTPNSKMFPSFNPYHVHEVDYAEITQLFSRHFKDVQIYGVFGDDAVMRYRTSKQKISDMILRFDVLHARTWLPQVLIRMIYAFVSFFFIKKISYFQHSKEAAAITTKNFRVAQDSLEKSLDFIAVAKNI